MYPKTSSKSPAILKPMAKSIVLTVSTPKEAAQFEGITGHSLGATNQAKFVAITLEGTKPEVIFITPAISQLAKAVNTKDASFTDLTDYLNRYTIYKLTQDMEIFR